MQKKWSAKEKSQIVLGGIKGRAVVSSNIVSSNILARHVDMTVGGELDNPLRLILISLIFT